MQKFSVIVYIDRALIDTPLNRLFKIFVSRLKCCEYEYLPTRLSLEIRVIARESNIFFSIMK